MSIEEAQQIISLPIEDFNIGDIVYYASYEPRVLKMKVVRKRISLIGLKPCYSLYTTDFKKVVHSSICYIFKDKEAAKKCHKALKVLRKHFDNGRKVIW